LSLRDPVYPLHIDLVYRVIAEHDVIVRSAVVHNSGNQPIALERIMTAVWHFPIRDHFHLRTLAGKWAGEFQIQDVPVTLGKHVIERRSGSTGFANNPYFALTSDAHTSTPMSD
jgi:alpha-galactosidase